MEAITFIIGKMRYDWKTNISIVGLFISILCIISSPIKMRRCGVDENFKTIKGGILNVN